MDDGVAYVGLYGTLILLYFSERMETVRYAVAVWTV